MVSATSDTKLRAMLVSDYTEGECESRWIPTLEQRGVRVDRVLPVHQAHKAEVHAFDVVLFMYERAGHKHDYAIRGMCKRSGVRLQMLRTSIATWPPDFREKEQLVALTEQPTVSDDDLEPFLKEFQARWEHGERIHNMVEPLAHYWRVGTLQKPTQLADYVKYLVDSKRAPEWFTKWWSAARAPLALVPPAPASLATIGEAVQTYTMRRKPTITDADFELACVEYATRWADGEKMEAMVEPMRRFWATGALTNGNQLYAYFWGHVKRGSCPKWFAEWWNKDREQRRAHLVPTTGEAMSAPRKSRIAEENVEAACRLFVEKFEGGASYDEMKPLFKEWWQTADVEKVPNGQFANTFRVLGEDEDRGPKWFVKWWKVTRPTIDRSGTRTPPPPSPLRGQHAHQGPRASWAECEAYRKTHRDLPVRDIADALGITYTAYFRLQRDPTCTVPSSLTDAQRSALLKGKAPMKTTTNGKAAPSKTNGHAAPTLGEVMAAIKVLTAAKMFTREELYDRLEQVHG